MKIVRCIIIVTAITFVLPAKAQNRADQQAGSAPQVVGGTLVPVYLVTGVRASGTDNSGPATSFICTVSSGAVETINIKVLNSGGMQVIDQNINVGSPNTQTFSTNATVLFSEVLLSAPAINPAGVATIFATSNLVFCTAMLLDAANASPQGIALHQVRFNSAPGIQE
jgi:hypothetical protein